VHAGHRSRGDDESAGHRRDFANISGITFDAGHVRDARYAWYRRFIDAWVNSGDAWSGHRDRPIAVAE